MAGPGFADDLKAAQIRLHQDTAEHAALVRALLWSVELHGGWPGTGHPHTKEISGGREPSPGWTDEQKLAVARVRLECLDLGDGLHSPVLADAERRGRVPGPDAPRGGAGRGRRRRGVAPGAGAGRAPSRHSQRTVPAAPATIV
ncbi:hypothetical protein [Streptomyces zhihengii]|uniref:hypothetical protein n=1 Tax=Streptomyces zhihengii TaxID=1818004 RepID=UPI00339E4FEA